MTEAVRLSVPEREAAIFRLLSALPDAHRGLPARQIWRDVRAELADTVTPQAYYKILDRLVAAGKLDVLDQPGGKRYAVAPRLHAGSALTLDDLYEVMDGLAPTEALARIAAARSFLHRRQHTVLAAAARRLLHEDPRELVERMLDDAVARCQADRAVADDHDLRDPAAEARAHASARELDLLAYRHLGLSRSAVDTRDPSAPIVDRDRLRLELSRRLLGRTAVEFVAPEPTANRISTPVTVAGSGATTHASVLTAGPGGTGAADGSDVVTFNNSVVFVRPPRPLADRLRAPYYSVPMARSAMDDRNNRGMVLAPFMFRYLSESEYEHMAKCATDVVQWRADEAVFLGTARALGDGALLPKPRVHVRDGTVTPQEREFGHYARANEYGDMVREGLAHTRKILGRVSGTDDPPVFAGAVKSTQSTFFGSVLNWFVARGSARDGEPSLDPEWDAARHAQLPDHEVMTLLLATISDQGPPGSWPVTFVLARPFHSLTEYYRHADTGRPGEWNAFFSRRRERDLTRFGDGDDPEPAYLASVDDVADDDFVYLCEHADYASFYVGHTGGEPAPLVPRYEFLEDFRRLGPDAADDRATRNRRMVVQALVDSGLSIGASTTGQGRVLPAVVSEASDMCRSLGRKLEAELRSIVLANLHALQGETARDLAFRPISLNRFATRFSRAAGTDRTGPR